MNKSQSKRSYEAVAAAAIDVVQNKGKLLSTSTLLKYMYAYNSDVVTKYEM